MPVNSETRAEARSPIRSMTGYAVVRKPTSAGELTVSLRSVNGRGLDLHFYSNSEFASFENSARTLLKQHIARGHVEIRMALSRESDGNGISYNRDLLARYIRVFEQARADFSLQGTLDLNALFSIPALFENTRDVALHNDLDTELADALALCLEELNAFREREGRELVSAIHIELEALERAAAQISAIRASALPQFQQRLRERLSTLLGDNAISESRLAEEAAVLADRSDIQEEITRLTVHAQELGRMLCEGGELGKKLDFLLQEMNRETNTVLSKTSGIGETGLTITNLGLAIKANIERIREQALNLE